MLFRSLDQLLVNYRAACPDPEPGANFMPTMWQRIEARRSPVLQWVTMSRRALAGAMALCALLLRPHRERQGGGWWQHPIRAFFAAFNLGFDKMAAGYGWLAARVVRYGVIMLLAYAGIIAFGLNELRKTPRGFIPALDRGYLIVVSQLPPGSSLARTDAVQRRVVDIAMQVPGVKAAVNIEIGRAHV